MRNTWRILKLNDRLMTTNIVLLVLYIAVFAVLAVIDIRLTRLETRLAAPENSTTTTSITHPNPKVN